jgi:protein phosphatase
MSGAEHADASTGSIRLKLFGRTDVGQIREHNEDNFLIADLSQAKRGLMESDREQVVGPKGTVFAVCDGMGGAAAGEVASQFAVDIVFEKLSTAEPPRDRDELARRLVTTIEDAGLRIFNEARADRTRRGMGTTATVAALIDDRLFIGQVGDSRAYLLRGETFVQVTRDQSLVNQLIEAGQLTEEEAETFEHNNIILQALGTSESVQVDLTYVDLRRGDRLLLCSDGLSGMIRGDDIRESMISVREPFEACKVLTDKANQSGGHDNITVLVIEFDGEGLRSPSEEDEPLAYRKYPLPEANAETVPVGTVPATPQNLETSPPSAEAERESRRLRVGHTKVGVQNPLASLAPPTSGDFPPTDRSPGGYSPGEEPIELPTTGLPPQLLGFIVLGALLVVAVMGFLLLR